MTVTDPEMTRYFMTVREATGLVLQAAALAERGEVFVLDMGEPARIVDLAHRMIRLAGLVPNRDIEVSVTGPRPGEKTTESLSVEPLRASKHPRIRVARPTYPDNATVHMMLEVLREEIEGGDSHRLTSLLRRMAWQEWGQGQIIDLTELEELGSWA